MVDPDRNVFVGRSAEMADIVARAGLAAGGETQVVWIEGEGGAGKSALVRRVLADLADRFRVLQSVADESSGDVSFSTVAQLGVRPAENTFATGLALVEHLGSVRTGPVVAVVEDLHWADAASRAALLLAARRLQHDAVLLLITSRATTLNAEWARFVADPGRCTALTLGGLGVADVREMAAGAGVTLTWSTAERLTEHTLGHPLHVRTLLRELTPAQLSAPGATLLAPRSLAAATTAGLAGMPSPSRAMAAALAVYGRPAPLAVLGGLAGVDDPTGALEPLLDTGIVTWAPSAELAPVRFAHPLQRAAVYEDLDPQLRRRLHRACAAVTSWGPSWAHRVAAADGPDEALADELDAAADYEVARRDLPLAATYLWWASTVAPAARRQELALRSVQLLALDGQTGRATEQFARIDGLQPSTLGDLVSGTLAFARAEPARAETLLMRVAEDITAPDSQRADAHSQLAALSSLRGAAALQVHHGRAALALSPAEHGLSERRAWSAVATGEATLHGGGHGVAVLNQRLPRSPATVSGPDADLLVVRGLLEVGAGRTAAAVDDLRTAIELARSGFGFVQLPRAHLTLARALYRQGAWDESMVQARLAATFDADRAWLPRQAESAMATVLAGRGDLDRAAVTATEAVRLSAQLGSVELLFLATGAAASVAHARADHAGVVAAFAGIADGTATTTDMTPLTVLSWLPWYAAALIDTGDLAGGEAASERLATIGAATGIAVDVYVAGLRGQLAAARGGHDRAVEHFAGAVAARTADHPALDTALLHHAHGRSLRAIGQRRLGEDQLRLAHRLLERLGAGPYLARVEVDLGGPGTSSPTRRAAPKFELSARELDVATLVKKGLTNKEVGAELYLSAKAIEFHLSKVYAKLGIASRRDLRDVDLGPQ